jgi:hypothetical protein
MLDTAALGRITEKESALPAMVNKNLISSETANLMKGLDKAVEATDFKNRQKRQLPGLTELLLHSNYLTPETMEWISRELPLQDKSTEEFLRKNFLASEDTLRNAAIILNTLKSILYKT